MEPEVTYRNVVYRLHPRSRRKHDRMMRTAGACRYVWNWALAENHRRHEETRLAEGLVPLDWPEEKAQAMRQAMRPNPTFFSLGREFTRLRRETGWLQDLPYKPVRHTLKYQADAWKRYFNGRGGPAPVPGKARG